LPELGDPIKIAKLAGFLIRRRGNGRVPEIEIQFTRLRPGDKLSEDLISIREKLHPTSDAQLWRVSSPSPAPEMVDETLARLKESAQARDLPMMLEAMRQLVPEYMPSETLLNFASDRGLAAHAHE
jgi:FlaA1/EpsC-like NDP-sugar epimerase